MIKTNHKERLSLVVPCAFALVLIMILVRIEADPGGIVQKIASVFFIEPF